MALFFTKISEGLLANPDEATKYIEQTIWQVCFANVQEHTPWEKSVARSAHGIMYNAKGNNLPQPQFASQETVEKEKSLLDATLKKDLETKTKGFSKVTEKGLKVAIKENERVEEERFSYLEMPFKTFPRYTPLFFRRTNMAEYCLIGTGYHVRCSKVRKQNPDQHANEVVYYETPLHSPMGSDDSTIKKIAGGLASGLLNGVLGKVGALIFEAIFPPGTPSYFTEVYKEIQKIVHQEITENTIAELNGRINGTKNWVCITYYNAKVNDQSKKELTDLLQPKEADTAIEINAVLMEERFAKPGLCVFMIGAGMHLALLQELAYVDPYADSPSTSHYVESVKKYAQLYANHAIATFNSIISTRLGMIRTKDSYDYIDGTRYYFYSFTDNFSGYRESYTKYCDTKGCHRTDSEEKRNAGYNKHKNNVKNDLVEKMADPVGTANQWLQLKTKPLPPEPTHQFERR